MIRRFILAIFFLLFLIMGREDLTRKACAVQVQPGALPFSDAVTGPNNLLASATLDAQPCTVFSGDRCSSTVTGSVSLSGSEQIVWIKLLVEANPGKPADNGLLLKQCNSTSCSAPYSDVILGNAVTFRLDFYLATGPGSAVTQTLSPKAGLTIVNGGGGRVTSTPEGIDCGGTCTYGFNYRESVSLTASPNAGYTFEGWSGSSCAGAGACQFMMDLPRTVTATFKPRQYSLTVTNTGNGKVTSDLGGIDCGSKCSASYDSGTSVKLTATANAGYQFDKWTGDACSGSTASVCTIAMNQDKSITAAFKPLPQRFTLTVVNGGNGRITSDSGGIDCGSACSATYDSGTSVRLTAVANSGYQFDKWSGDACDGSTNSACTLTMTQNRSVTGTFKSTTQRYTLTVTNSGNGKVTSDIGGIDCGSACSASYDSGASVKLTATANTGYQFDKWGGDACSGSTDTVCTVTMTQNRSVTAAFKVKSQQYTLTVTNTGNGKVSSDKGGIACGSICSASFDAGTSVQLSAAPDSGYMFDKWSGDACNGSSNSVCTISMTKDIRVTASFTVLKPKLTVVKSGTGAGTVTSKPAGIDCGSTCSFDFSFNQVVTLTAQAAEESEFSGWTGCDQVPPTAPNTCLVTMAQSRSVGATFNPPGKRTLIISKVGAGTVTSNPAGIDCGYTCVFDFDYNLQVTLSAQAEAGFSFVGWSGANCSGTGTCSVTMNQAWNITATFASGNPRLTIVKPGTGAGIVTSSPAGINCGATCSYEFSLNQQVELTAQALSGSVFAGWSGCSSQSGNKCKVTMTQDLNIGALFNQANKPRATVLIYPSGDVIAKKPQYKWSAVADATWYQLWVNDSATSPRLQTWFAASQAGCASGTGTCAVEPDAALAAGSCRWWVQTWNEFGYGPWSAELQFTIITTPPAAILSSPLGSISTNKPTYKWSAVPTSTWYQLWVNDSFAAPKIKDLWLTALQAGCASGTGSCSVTPDATLAAGSYRWWVQTWNESGLGPWSSGLSFTVPSSVGPPGKTTLVSPVGTTTTNAPVFVWGAISNATWYQLFVRDASSGSGTAKLQKWYSAAEAQCASGTGSCSANPGITLSIGAGQWWVQTWNSAGYGPWSDPLSFTITGGAPPGKALLASPTGIISNTSPPYSWKAVPSASRYQLLVKDSGGIIKIKQWYSAQQTQCSTGTGTCTITPAVALPPGIFDWWVQTSNNYGDGPWSDPLRFTLLPGFVR